MKYKNYRNPHTNDSRIYSFNDLCNMLFGDVVKRKKEILGQYKTIGVPTEQDLQSSENVVYVESYTRDDGTEVKAHYRSKPGCGSIAPDDSYGIMDEDRNSGNQNTNQDAQSSQYGDGNPIITILSAITDLVLSQVAPEYRKIAQSVLGIITSAFQNVFSGISDDSNSEDGELTGGAADIKNWGNFSNRQYDYEDLVEQYTKPIVEQGYNDYIKDYEGNIMYIDPSKDDVPKIPPYAYTQDTSITTNTNNESLTSKTTEEISKDNIYFSDETLRKAREFLHNSEGYSAEAYKDIAGVWTIGYGHTGFVDDKPIDEGMKITKEKAEELYRKDFESHSNALSEVRVPLTENQKIALTSFIYNFGIYAFKKSTLLEKLNAGDIKGAADEFDVWVKAYNPKTGVRETSQGLINRRKREKELFLKPDR